MNTETLTLPVRDNIVLRFIRPEEAETLYALVDRNRAYLRRWLNWVDEQTGPEVSRQTILKRIENAAAGTELEFGIYRSGELIGSMGFNKLSRRNRSGEVGYWLSEEFQGKGVMTDCVRALIEYGFKELELHRIEIGCCPSNLRSRAIPERLGFVFEGTAREAYLLNGRFEDSRKYGLLQHERRR